MLCLVMGAALLTGAGVHQVGDDTNLAKISVTYMAGSADLMRIDQTAIWRVRRKRPFLVYSDHTRQNSVLVATRLYLPEVCSPAVYYPSI